MGIKDVAHRRKTVRKFKNEKVSMEDILYCIDVAREAPSGMNAQPWKFLIITDEAKKKEIKKICEGKEKEFHGKIKGMLSEWLKEKNISWKKEFLQNAPLLLLIFSHKKSAIFYSINVACNWLPSFSSGRKKACNSYIHPSKSERCMQAVKSAR